MLKLFRKDTTPSAVANGPRTLRPRPPRDDMQCSATLRVGDAYHRAQLRDVSKHGCKIFVEAPLVAGAQVQIALEAYHSLGAIVRWYRDGLAGIQFNVPLSAAVLLTWKDAVSRERAAPTALAPRRARNFLGEKLYAEPAEE